MAKSKLSPVELTIHNQFTRYGRNAREWLRKCAVLLPKIEKYEIWQKRRCSSIYEYAAKIAGMNHDQTREALRVMNRIKDKPELIAMAEKKGINAVRPVATIATRETARFWAGCIEVMSVQGVTAMAREKRRGMLGGDKSRNVSTSQPEKMHHVGQNGMGKFGQNAATETMAITLNLPIRLARKLDRIRKREDFNQLLGKFVEEVEREEEGRKPVAIETDSRQAPAAMERFCKERTGNKCAFPGCDKPIYHLHHTQRWALHPIHDPDKLWGLCQAHNELAHLGLIENEGKRPEEWRLREKADWGSGTMGSEDVGREDAANWDKWVVDQRVQLFREPSPA